jgi:hypothetical protein
MARFGRMSRFEHQDESKTRLREQVKDLAPSLSDQIPCRLPRHEFPPRPVRIADWGTVRLPTLIRDHPILIESTALSLSVVLCLALVALGGRHESPTSRTPRPS